VKRIGLYPRVQADTRGAGVVSQAGGVALIETVRASGLDQGLAVALGRWRKPMAIHDPAKVITDLAVALALGGDCLADIALLRADPAVFGLVASDPTCRARLTRWLRMRRRHWPRSIRRGRLPGRGCGGSLVSTHPITVSRATDR
jgi:Transposase DDE domain group 1